MPVQLRNYRLISLICLSVTVSTLALPAFSTDQIGKIYTYQDWMIGCDNSLYCTATSLDSDALRRQYVHQDILQVRRTNAPSANLPALQVVYIVIAPDNKTAKVDACIAVDGACLFNATFKPDRDFGGDLVATTDDQDQAQAVIASAIKGKKMEVKVENKTIGTISLAGAAAALRHMDAMQNRADTPTALVAKGSNPYRPIHLPLPLVHVLPERSRSAPPFPSLSAAEESQVHARALAEGCEERDPAKMALFTIEPLDEQRSLILYLCEIGTNLSHLVMIASRPFGTLSLDLAVIDNFPAGTGYRSRINNGSFSEDGLRLYEYWLGRGIGDCGAEYTRVWDGKGFRVTSATVMEDCRGILIRRYWIKVFEASINRDKQVMK